MPALLPGALLQSFSVSPVSRTEVTMSGQTVYEYAADLGAGFSLTGGTSYWLSIYNDTTADTDDNWSWLSGQFGTGAYAAFGNFENWQGNNYRTSMYFALSNSNVAPPVPLPASLPLLLSGALGLGFLRSLRRNSHR